MKSPFFYDVTLRDGNQALKKPWNQQEKEKLFGFLVRLGVQGAEVGYPGASQMDFDCAVRLGEIAPAGMVIGALARTLESDIKVATRALRSVNRRAIPRVHTFIGMSPFYMESVLRKSPEEVRQIAMDAVKTARVEMGGQGEIQFSPEHFGDCSENLSWVIESLLAIVEAGAMIINLPNTVERTCPTGFVKMVRRVIEAMPKHVIVAVHCHNDLGMGTATTVESFFAGARQLEVTLNGLGERAGNTSLCEAAVALYCNDIAVDINLEDIYEIALEVAKMSGIPIPLKSALIGPEVLKHRSGIHQSGAIKTDGEKKGAYRPIDPELIGRAGDEEYEFTSQSGATAIEKIIRETGRIITVEQARVLQPALKSVSEDRGALTQDQLAMVFDAFQELQGKKENVSPEDVVELARDVVGTKTKPAWVLVRVRADSDSQNKSTATVCLQRGGDESITDAAVGDGAIDAAIRAIKRITGKDPKVEDYGVRGVTPGSDAQGKARFTLSMDGKERKGEGTDTDVVLASIKAFLCAFNQFLGD